ncbi:MAG: ABC transporter permease [Cyanobacteria bacterium P01_C01_bin.89]
MTHTAHDSSTRFPALLSRLTNIPAQRKNAELLRSLVIRDLEAKYSGSMLGTFWSLVHQLSQIAIYTYVFSVILQVKLNISNVPESNFTFGTWLYAGLLPWNTLIASVTQSSLAVLNQPNLVKKVVFPLGLLPLVPVATAFIESLPGVLLLLIMDFLGDQSLPLTLFLLPFIWLPQLLFTTGLAYLLAGLTVFIRDLPQLILIVINLWFYLTPLVYPVSVIPNAWRDWVFWLNPVATIAEVYRDLLIVGSVNHLSQWIFLGGISTLLFGIGWKTYRALRPSFSDVL